MLNVRDFGALGDGQTDDTAAIQAALDAAGERHETVEVPAGTYLCGELFMREGTGLRGTATSSYQKAFGSVLRLNDPAAKSLLNITCAYGAYVHGLCLHGMDLAGDAPIHGIMVDKEVYGSQEDAPRIDSCRIEHFSGDAIHLNLIWCFSVRHSHCIYNGGHALYIRGWDGFVLDNWFSGNGGAGFKAYHENASVTLTGNRVEWNSQGGIVINGGQHYNITGNYIDRSGRCGIKLGPRDDSVCNAFAITGNVIYRSGRPDWGRDDDYDSAHARFERCRGLVFTGNAMNAGRDDSGRGSLSPEYGLVLRDLDDAVIKDNVLHQGYLKEMVLDLGGHGPNLVVEGNMGSVRPV